MKEKVTEELQRIWVEIENKEKLFINSVMLTTLKEWLRRIEQANR